MTGDAPAQSLTVAIGDYALTRSFRTTARPDSRLRLTTFGIGGSAIPEMLNRQAFDACEMPIVTFLQAFAARMPFMLLPVTLVGRLQHGTIVYDASRGELAPRDLAGRRIGVRSWSRTTGVWARGILAGDYGVDLGSIEWVTFEPSHIAPLADPSVLAGAGKAPLPMLLEGDLDAVIGEASDKPRIRPLIPAPERAARDWCRRHGVVPINHMLVVREDLVRERPEGVEELYSLLRQGRRSAPLVDASLDMNPFGIEANRRALEMVIGFAAEQLIIPAGIAVDDLFDDTIRRLDRG